MAAKRQKIHFESVEELLGAPITKDVTEEIQISQIRPFKDHPFKVIDDTRPKFKLWSAEFEWG
jgi:ParB family chromosome partitioning protein